MNLYICCSMHHLIVALSKVCAKKIDADILLVQKSNMFDKEIPDRIKNSKIVNNVYFCEVDDIDWLFLRRNIFRYLLYRYFKLNKEIKNRCDIDWHVYDNIITFYDADCVGAFLNINKLNYTIIEDAPRCFSMGIIKRLPMNFRLLLDKKTDSISLLIKKNILIPIFGESNYCKSIEVEDLNDLYISDYNKYKYKLFSTKTYFESLSAEQKKILINIFLNKINIDISKPIKIVFTEPLQIDRRILSNKSQIDIYKELIEAIEGEVPIIIKPHPRDDMDYTNLLSGYKNVYCLPRSFPSELLNFFDIGHILGFYTISSSAIYSFPVDKQHVLKDFFSKDVRV